MNLGKATAAGAGAGSGATVAARVEPTGGTLNLGKLAGAAGGSGTTAQARHTDGGNVSLDSADPTDRGGGGDGGSGISLGIGGEFAGGAGNVAGARAGTAGRQGGAGGPASTGQRELGSGVDLYIDDLQTTTDDGPLTIYDTIPKWGKWIDVCFLANSSGKDSAFSLEQRTAIRQTVTNHWGRATGLAQFVGFGVCRPPPAMRDRVVIRVDSSLPTGVLANADALGEPSYPAFTTVSFRDTDPSERTILHVFGHVLGFLHPKDPACDSGTAGASGTATDPSRSVMSQEPCRAGASLTARDIVAAQTAYGRHAAGSVVGMNDLCMDIYLPIPEGACGTAQVYECHGGHNQQWRMSAGGILQPPDPEFSNSALEVHDNIAVDGAQVLTCEPKSSSSVNQRWHFEQVEIRGIGDLCVDLSSPTASSGQTLRIRPCTGQLSQKWNVEWLSTTSTTKLRMHPALAQGWCVGVPRETEDNLELGSCTPDPGQQFTITDLGELRLAEYCWSSEGADVRYDGRMLFEPCVPDGNGKRHQQYFLRGTIRSELGMCLTTNRTDFQASDPLYVYTCSGAPDFAWDYYFLP